MLWNLLARAQRLDWLTHMTCVPGPRRQEGRQVISLPTNGHRSHSTAIFSAIARRMQRLAGRLTTGAVAFIVGPASVGDGCRSAGVTAAGHDAGGVSLHVSHASKCLTRAQYQPGIMLYQVAGLMATSSDQKDLTGWADHDCRVA